MENIIPRTEWNVRLTEENEFRLLIFFPFWGRVFSLWGRIFSFWQKIVSHKVKIFFHKRTIFCPYIFLYILRYSAKGKILSVWWTIFTHQGAPIIFRLNFRAVLDIFHSAARVYLFPHCSHSCPNLWRWHTSVFRLQHLWWNVVHLPMSSVSWTDNNLRAPDLASVADG